MKETIGVLLAGGTGSRLYPLTTSVNKHLLPVYSKPLIYYSLSTLMLAQNREVLLVINPKDETDFKNLLGDGSKFGIKLTYVMQENPKGIADALNKCSKLAKGKNINLILGDNIFYGKGLQDLLIKRKKENLNCFFSQEVNNPQNFGVVYRDKDFKATEIIEKPTNAKFSEAILGLYFYDNDVFQYIESLKPSIRGELEITDLNNVYLKEKSPNIVNIGRGISWFDAGTIEDLYEANNFIQAIEKRQDTLIGSLEEVSFNNGWIEKKDLEVQVRKIENTDYGLHLKKKFLN
jgi:glucose-1-phosphate thymidylyltransferase